MSEFEPWGGEYIRAHYDVETQDGEIIKHCWPSLGYMCTTDDSYRSWKPDDNIKIRLSEED